MQMSSTNDRSLHVCVCMCVRMHACEYVHNSTAELLRGFEDVALVEFMYLAFTCTSAECYHRRLRSLMLCLCVTSFEHEFNSLESWCCEAIFFIGTPMIVWRGRVMLFCMGSPLTSSRLTKWAEAWHGTWVCWCMVARLSHFLVMMLLIFLWVFFSSASMSKASPSTRLMLCTKSNHINYWKEC